MSWRLHVGRVAAAFGVVGLSPLLQGEIVIHEIHYHPAHVSGREPVDQEFIELFHTGGPPVSLEGWRLSRGVDFTFPAVTLRAGEFLVAAADPGKLQDAHPDLETMVVGGWTGRLSNSGEEIELTDSQGEIIDAVRYSDEGDWAQRRLGLEDRGYRGWIWLAAHDGGGRSLELVDWERDNGLGANWAASAADGGTPGRENSAHRSGSAPLLSEVRHLPAVPRSTEEVYVESRVSPDGAPATVGLFYRLSTESPGVFASTPMNDAGEDGDLRAGDSVFTGTIPPLPNGSVVEFYVEVSSAAGRRTWPAPSTVFGQRVANALYQVDDAADPPGMPVYRLILSVPEERAFRPGSFDRRSDAEMNATFIAGRGAEWEVRYLAGVRYRGNSSRNQVPPTLRVNLAGDRPWNGETSLNLNARFGFLQALAMETFHRAGLPAPEARLVRLHINGIDQMPPSSNTATHYGAYVHMQPLGSDFVTDQFPGDDGGNLYNKRSADPSRDRKRWGVHFDTQIVYNQPDWHRMDQWSKATNAAADDWSDLQDFIVTVNEAPDATYLEEMSARIDIEQWLRWFALMVLMNNLETNLSNGIDDDYAMYSGVIDPRFVLLPHDLDSVFGGDTKATLFPMLDSTFGAGQAWIPQLQRFFDHPVIRRGYFRALRDLSETALSDAVFGETVENLLGDIVPAERRAEIRSWMRARNGYVRSRVNPPLASEAMASEVSGFPQVLEPRATLRGSVGIVDVERVQVNGFEAELDRATGEWSLTPGVPLSPGINRVIVEALDGMGAIIEEDHVDVWYENGSRTVLEGFVNVNRTLTAAGGPYLIRGSLVVPAGRRLAIDAGTNVFFERDAELKVLGELAAEGRPYRRIRFSSAPGAAWVPDIRPGLPEGPPKWKGIHFEGTLSEENRIVSADIIDAQDLGGSVGLVRSRARLSALSFAGTRLRMVYGDNAAGFIENSRFPDMFGPGEDPAALDLDNISEHIKIIGRIPAGERLVIRGNHFGTNRGHNDVIDADSGQLPGPIVEILDNVFTGAGDELLDLGGDAYVAGNFFTRVFKDGSTSDRGYANAISQGDGPTGVTVYVNRNVFFDVDHAVSVKNGAATVFENNTVARVHPDFRDRFDQLNVGSAINLFVDEPGAITARGAYVADNIFVDLPRVFGNVDLPAGSGHLLRFHHNMIPPEIAGDPVLPRQDTLFALGEGNRAGLPAFAGPERGDFRLAEDSPARGAGGLGQDLGAMIEPRMYVAGEPDWVTDQRTVVLRTGGPGMATFQHRVNGGPWSLEVNLPSGLEPAGAARREGRIELSGLTPGDYVVEVRGRDFAGNLQAEPTASRVWTVGEPPQDGALRISEVLAANVSVWEWNGVFPDFVEIHNGTDRRVDLSGMTLSDDPGAPGKWVFPQGSQLAAGAYLILPAGGETPDGEAVLPFGLAREGEGVFLYAAPQDGGMLLDSVVFGLQLPDYTVGRVPGSGAPGSGTAAGGWTLCRPTPGSVNTAARLGSARGLRINEWLATSRVLYRGDFAEIYNPAPDPVDLGGLFLTDDPRRRPERHRIRDLSFVAPKGFAVFEFGREASAAGSAALVEFGLAASFDRLALLDEGRLIDEVMIGAEVADVSRGRTPDGEGQFADFRIPTPGAPNAGLPSVIGQELTAWDAVWRFDQSDTGFGPAWKETEFDDSGWESGAGVFFVENAFLPLPKMTPLRLNPPHTHYFRRHFDAGEELWTQARLELLVDDGAVVWLNGEELLRLRMPDGTVAHETFALSGVNNAVVEGPFPVESGRLRPGPNVLVVEVHQDDIFSSDVVFAARLWGARQEGGLGLTRLIRILDQLRITEMMVQPAGGEPWEFVELQNVGAEPLQLEGLRFVDGIAFVFPEWTLEPGAIVLVVQNRAAFEERYGGQWPVIGEYSGRLSDDGERIRLLLPEPFDAAVLDFRFNGGWYAETAGGGSSLIMTDPSRPAAVWDDPRSWQPSPMEGGTPGRGAAPLITSALFVETTLGDPFTYAIEATNNPVTYMATGLPQGLALDPHSGEVAGIAQEYGLFRVSLEVSNSVGPVRRELVLLVKASGPAAAFVFEPMTPGQLMGIPFAVGLRAVDAAGRTVVDYEAPGPLDWVAIGMTNGAPVRITEIGDREIDFVEYQNLGTETVDTSGWVLLFNDASEGSITHVHGLGREGVVWRLESSLAGARTRWVSDHPSVLYVGGDIAWNHAFVPVTNDVRKGWAMLLDAQGEVADFVVWGYPEKEIRTLTFDFEGRRVTVEGAWNGGPAEYRPDFGLTLQRRGAVDRNHAEDWEWATDTAGFINGGLEFPLFTDEVHPVEVVDDQSFHSGRWTGRIRVHGSGPGIRLTVSDGEGLRGESAAFDLALPAPPVITSPLEVEAVVGEPFHYRIEGEGYPDQFAVENLPEGLYRDGVDESVIRGAPEEPGEYLATISAANAVGEDQATLRIQVLVDGDGDGMPDSWEIEHGLDPEVYGRTEDSDADGTTDWTEYRAGTDPRDPKSAFRIVSVDREGDAVQLVWTSKPGRRYRVWEASSSPEPVWVPVMGGELRATGVEAAFRHQLPSGQDRAQRLYRVEVLGD
ncbi:MAG TPA: lamin tail domain-containing protein [Verrucomicrobiales bacterium]|nr:lamin tail domain-containing protein [Verrucomicrobiales bacterium]